jgi:carbamate kinase
VIDKDLASALFASSINADMFLISTEVEKVAINFNKPNVQWLDKLTVDDAKKYLAEGQFGIGIKLREALSLFIARGLDPVANGL